MRPPKNGGRSSQRAHAGVVKAQFGEGEAAELAPRDLQSPFLLLEETSCVYLGVRFQRRLLVEEFETLAAPERFFAGVNPDVPSQFVARIKPFLTMIARVFCTPAGSFCRVCRASP